MSTTRPTPGAIQRRLDWFDRHWDRVRPWLTCLWIARASLFSVLFGLILFCVADAVHDILRGLAQDLTEAGHYEGRDWYRLIAFALCSLLWAAFLHFCARILLWLDVGALPDDPLLRACYRQPAAIVPRALGHAALLTVAIGIGITWYGSGIRSSQPTENLAFFLLLVLVAVEMAAFQLYAMITIDRMSWVGAAVRRGLVTLAAQAFRMFRSSRDLNVDSESASRTPDTTSAPRETKRSRASRPGTEFPTPTGWRTLFAWLEIKQEEDFQPLFVRSAARNRLRGSIATFPITAAERHVWVTLLWTLIVLAGIGLGTMIFAMASPLRLGRIASQSGVLFLILSTWLPLFSVLTFLSHWRRFPSIVPVLVLSLLAQALSGDNHTLRLLPDAETAPDAAVAATDGRVSLQTALDIWTGANPQAAASAAEPAPTVPLVIVATAGGGSRAAYWTATVLGALEDQVPQFRNRVFAISAVSGGALGTAAFAALLQHDLKGGTPLFCQQDAALGRDPIEVQRDAAGKFQRCGQYVTAGDFLGPPFAALGYQDAIYWAFPVWPPQWIADRARAIEAAWEYSWWDTAERSRPADQGLFGRPFTEFGPAPGEPWRPVLLFNGTSVGTGKRIVATQLDFQVAPGEPLVLDAYDLFSFLPDGKLAAAQRLPLSTAVTVAARFPYVLPAGTLGGGLACDGQDKRPPVCDRVVDGGYFENFGAATADDVLLGIERLWKQEGKPAPWSVGGGRRVQPIIVQISSDPELNADAAAPKPPDAYDSRWSAEIVSPPESLLATQSARGVLAMQALRRRAEQLGIPFIHFSLHMDGDKGDVMPLSWALSRGAQKAIRDRLCSPYNQAQAQILFRELTGRTLSEFQCS